MESPGWFDGPRARDAFVLRVVMEPPWSIRVVDEAPLTAVALLSGTAWALGSCGAVAMSAGDVLLARDTEPYALASAPDAPPGAVIGAGQSCSAADGRDLSPGWRSGVRTWGNDPAGRDVMVVGTFRSRGEVGRLLTGTLPANVVVPDPDPALLPLLAREVERDAEGQSAVLDRLLDLLLIATLRQWSASGPGASGAAVAPSPDPVVHRTVQALHAEPQAPWTLEALARRAGLSRSALTRRFTQRVGTPPMTYLANWRLALGADLLDDPGLTLAAIARRVGYGSPFSFSAAFKKRYGVSPQEHRSR
ncbi:AraC family transcriptional regulator [Kineococcus arenarius]|uniref:AraC family transcriptional regulator n=1 Tax=unclassified Kineococcus TaxID=2621656 RepID=UPI003D7CCEA0